MHLRPIRLMLPLFVASALAPLGGHALEAQCNDSTRAAAPGSPSTGTAIFSVGTITDDLRRVAQDLGRCSTRGYLLRSSSTMTAPLPADMRWTFVVPSVDMTWNSALPFSMNDGPEWAGRGVTTSITGGVRGAAGRFSFSISPTLVYEQNRIYSILSPNAPNRSSFASPFNSGVESLDMPIRFGARSNAILLPGESWVEAKAGQVIVGASTDEQWWGPGIRNALVMSNNAAGIPQLYLRSAHPLSTPIGDVEFRWLLGGLTESLYFDTLGTNNLRALSAVVATLRVAADTGLTLGIARSVYSNASGVTDLVPHALDALFLWNQTPDTVGNVPRRASDQLLSVFGRWVFPESGFETYVEWTRLFPPNLRELLVSPQLHQGYTVGLQWVKPVHDGAAVRFQGEVTQLEQTPATTRGIVPSFYTSRFVPQGYTQNGQVIGAAIGPGSSSQFLAGDYLASKWRLGLELGRIRWDDDVYYRTPNGVSFAAHDVSIFAGVRGGVTRDRFDIDAEAVAQQRLNYLFQSAASGYAQDTRFDVNNVTFRLRVTPR